jgi:hypothetical protein
MNRTFRNGILLTAVLTLVGAPSAWAVCSSVVSQPVWNGGLGFISNCPDANQVAGWIYLLSAPGTTNSGAQSNAVVCEQAGDGGLGIPCQPEADAPGQVTINYEFGPGNPGAVGCPNPSEAGPDGVFPIGVQVVCNNGAGAIMQFGYAQGLLMYLVEQAFPFDNFIDAGFGNGPQLTSFTPGPTSDMVCVNVPNPTVHSDCNAGTQGDGSTCTDGGSSRPQNVRGNLYIQQAPCDAIPDPRNVTPWAPAQVQPDAAGAACNTVPKAAAGSCQFVGATARVGVNETGSMIGWLRVGALASNDKVKIDKAEYVHGKLVVDFSTENETSIVGFNVYSGSTKLNGSLIAAKGTGSNTYTFEVGRGATKGGKSVIIEAAKSDGTFEKTAPVALK